MAQRRAAPLYTVRALSCVKYKDGTLVSHSLSRLLHVLLLFRAWVPHYITATSKPYRNVRVLHLQGQKDAAQDDQGQYRVSQLFFFFFF